MTGKVALATSNAGKRKELAELLADLDVEIVLPDAADLNAIEETGKTFVENALIKAQAIANATQLPTIADDSGLIVEALGGRPGVHSARFAGLPSDASRNNEKLLHAMREIPDENRNAHFACVLVYVRRANDPLPILAQGMWHGHILRESRGDGGFGYDPLFFDANLGKSAAELPAETKNAVSHRAKASQTFIELLREQLD